MSVEITPYFKNDGMNIRELKIWTTDVDSSVLDSTNASAVAIIKNMILLSLLPSDYSNENTIN